MHEIIDPTTPRAQLPFEQLPRGFVPWPKRILDALEAEPTSVLEDRLTVPGAAV